MVKKPLIREHNAQTGEITDREMTDLEFSEYENRIEAENLAKIEEQNKAAAKSELLSKLGITENEAKLLLS